MATAGGADLNMILQQLPDLLLLSDITFYVFGILFFGSVAMRGFRGFLHPLPHFGVRILMGLASMIGGIALHGFFPSLSVGLYQLLGMDILAGSLLASVALGVGLYFLTFRLVNVNALQKRIRDLEERLKKVKKVHWRGIRDPAVWVGVGLIVLVLAISLIGFRGFPRISDSFLSFLGLSEADLAALGNQAAVTSPGCKSPLSLLQATGPDLSALPVVRDPALQAAFEKAAGSPVSTMVEASVEGKKHVIAVMEGAQVCSATAGTVCSCLDVSPFLQQ